jgi:hypothetical protein
MDGVDVVVASQEPSADPAERVDVTATVPEGVVLYSAANLVEDGVGEKEHIEVVDHPFGAF